MALSSSALAQIHQSVCPSVRAHSSGILLAPGMGLNTRACGASLWRAFLAKPLELWWGVSHPPEGGSWEGPAPRSGTGLGRCCWPALCLGRGGSGGWAPSGAGAWLARGLSVLPSGFTAGCCSPAEHSHPGVAGLPSRPSPVPGRVLSAASGNEREVLSPLLRPCFLVLALKQKQAKRGHHILLSRAEGGHPTTGLPWPGWHVWASTVHRIRVGLGVPM